MFKIKPLARHSEIVTQEMGKEMLIYDLKINKAFNLNEPSAFIWQLSNGEKTISEIADDLTLKFNSPISEEFVCLALDQLRKENLLENQTGIETLYGEISRRQLAKKVGLASLIALPVVSSLIAPMATQAQSNVVVCVTAGNTTCRCPGTTAPPGSGPFPSCGQGNFVVNNGLCNPNCLCTRTALTCPTTGGLAGTCQGVCTPPL